MEKLHIPLTERLKSIPEIFGIRLNEEAHYEVVKKDGAFEIRQYSRQLIARVTIHEPNFEKFKGRAFEKLARYIFGENHQGMK